MLDKKIISVSLLALLLGACAGGVAQKPSDWRAQQEWAGFEASGRLGVKVKEQGSYANFDWARQNGVETIEVNTPLGTTVGQLCRDAEGVLALDSKGQMYQADTPSRLSEMLLGYALPLEHLGVWANGEWVANAPYRINDDGTLQQYGWVISREYRKNGLPYSLELENSQMSIRMVFSDVSRSAGIATVQERCEARSSHVAR